MISPNRSIFAGPMPSIARSSFGVCGTACARAVKVRSCRTMKAGTRSFFASVVRHSRIRATNISCEAVRDSDEGGSGLLPVLFEEPVPPEFNFDGDDFAVASFFRRAEAAPFAERLPEYFSTMPLAITSSIGVAGRTARPRSVRRTLR